MRRLLIKLVAIETMLVGWLSYWIFLVYANNPSVSAGLGDQLSKFPQLAFTTVDIAVLVIIAAFAIMLAFKFHRGLRPGIRLERALQMLENLMKRNLVLEAQVAELRVEKVEKVPTRSTSSLLSKVSVPSISGLGPAALTSPESEPRLGSWEKAFRTPLEAGPSTVKAASSGFPDAPFQRETGIPPSRPESATPTSPPPSPPLFTADKAQALGPRADISEKSSEKQAVALSSSSSGWEDSPKYIGESTGVLSPSSIPRKTTRASESGGLKEPYIPVPAPRIPPPSVIVGPMSSKPASPGRQAPRPIVRPQFPTKSSVKEPASVPPLPEPKPAIAPIIIDKPPEPSVVDLKPSETSTPLVSSKDETKEKTADKPVEGYKKKPSSEED
ncbi:MAG TPA: hypothetical protein VFE96_04010 [Candidatus Bathyarchaeia archaeon]|nr:hypothetical protein [Candidatus Bathyarchaeia archaeon]